MIMSDATLTLCQPEEVLGPNMFGRYTAFIVISGESQKIEITGTTERDAYYAARQVFCAIDAGRNNQLKVVDDLQERLDAARRRLKEEKIRTAVLRGELRRAQTIIGKMTLAAVP